MLRAYLKKDDNTILIREVDPSKVGIGKKVPSDVTIIIDQPVRIIQLFDFPDKRALSCNKGTILLGLSVVD